MSSIAPFECLQLAARMIALVGHEDAGLVLARGQPDRAANQRPPVQTKPDAPRASPSRPRAIDEAARKAVFSIRARLKPRIGRETIHRRGEMVERSFAPVLDRGGMRRAWLRGRENIHKLHIAGFNLGVLMRAMHGQGTPREAAMAFIFVLQTDAALAFGPIAVIDGEFAAARRHRRRTDLKLKTGLRQRADRGYRDKVSYKSRSGRYEIELRSGLS